MQIKENAAVVNKQEEKIGHIDRIVVDPKEKKVTHIVVKKGLVFSREKVIPLDQVQEVNLGRVILKQGADDPEQWPNFEEKSHIPADRIDITGQSDQSDIAKPVMWYHPWVGLPWWGLDVYPSPQPPLYVAVTRNIPEGTVPIQEGAQVFSRDDKNLGEVEKVYTEPDENRITHLMLSKGIFSKENKLIPTYWVDSVEEDEVRLSIDSEVVESLPEGTLL